MNIEYTGTETELYSHRRGEIEAQDCYVWIECEERRMGAEANESSGVPEDVWHGHTQRFGLPGPVRGSVVDELLDRIESLAERICDGYTRTYDGNNYVAKFDDDAREALKEVESECDSVDRGDCVCAWNAREWLDNASAATLDITATTTDAQLDEMVSEIQSDAEGRGIDILEELSEYLHELRDELCEADDIDDADDQSEAV
jgi:hypothetical protein